MLRPEFLLHHARHRVGRLATKASVAPESADAASDVDGRHVWFFPEREFVRKPQIVRVRRHEAESCAEVAVSGPSLQKVGKGKCISPCSASCRDDVSSAPCEVIPIRAERVEFQSERVGVLVAPEVEQFVMAWPFLSSLLRVAADNYTNFSSPVNTAA